MWDTGRWSENPDGDLFASGLGTPKGIQITLGALESFLARVNRLYPPRPAADGFLNQAAFSFDLPVMDLLMSLASGGTLWSL